MACDYLFHHHSHLFTFKGPFLKLGQNIGLLVGAVFSGVGSDIWGRRLSFIQPYALHHRGFCPIWWSFAKLNYVMLMAVWSIGVGGNLPVDSAIFLEFIPATHQYPLTVLSVWLHGR